MQPGVACFRLPLPLIASPLNLAGEVELTARHVVRRCTRAAPLSQAHLALFVLLPALRKCVRLSVFLHAAVWESNFHGHVRTDRMQDVSHQAPRAPHQRRRTERLSYAEECMIHAPPTNPMTPARRVCILCLDAVAGRSTPCGHGHVVCAACADRWLGVADEYHPVRSLHPSLPCPSDLCGATILVDDLVALCRETTRAHVDRRRRRLRATRGRRDYWCARCGHWTAYDFAVRPAPQRFPCSHCGGALHVRARAWHRFAPFHRAPAEHRRILRRICTDDTGFTTCPVCELRLEHTSQCSTLQHCGVSICSMCGFHTVPGESRIPDSHWDHCYRYPTDAHRDHPGTDLRTIRRALHLAAMGP